MRSTPTRMHVVDRARKSREQESWSCGEERLGYSAYPFKGRRCEDGIKQEEDKEDGEKVRHGYCE